MATPTVLNGNVSVVEAGGQLADEHRMAWSHGGSFGAGVLNYDSFKPSWQAGMTLQFGLNASTNAAVAYVRSTLDGTLYSVRHSLTNPTITLDNGQSQPRVDQVVLAILDGQIDGSNAYVGQLMVINGTPISGANLDSGRTSSVVYPTTSVSAWIPICDVLVPASASALDATKVRNRRPTSVYGSIPPLNATGSSDADGDFVQMIPSPGLNAGRVKVQVGDGVGSSQSAALMWLPRRIKAARACFFYAQGSTANTGNFNIAICDAGTGLLIAQTGATAFSASANSEGRVEATLALFGMFNGDTNFHYDVGHYYVFFGVGAISSSSTMYFNAVKGRPLPTTDTDHGGTEAPSWNQFIYKLSGGTTFPPAGNLFNSGYSDAFQTGLATDAVLPVPVISLAT